MSVIGSEILAGASGQAAGYEIERSLRFDSSASSYLSRTPSSAGNRKTWTWSGWVKRALVTDDEWRPLFSAGGDALRFKNNTPADAISFNNSGTSTLDSTAVFRDPSAWYHVVLSVDTTLSSNRVKIYVNGSIVVEGNPYSQNEDTPFNNTAEHTIGRTQGASRYFDGYLADVHFIDGQALAASDFGEYDADNNWNPKAYSGSYGTNGFHLDFSDNSSNSALGEDSSGNNNDWTVNNLIAASGTVYTDDLAASGSLFSGSSLSNAFDGNTGTSAVMTNATQNQTLTFTPTGGIAYSSSVEVYLTPTGNVAVTRYSVNGGSDQSFSSGDGYKTILSGSGTLTSFVLKQGAQGNSVGFAAIRIDGTTILVDGEAAENVDSLIDTPTNYDASSGNNGGNYATLNPLYRQNGTLSNGNLDFNVNTNPTNIFSSIAMSSGKYYVELNCTNVPGNYHVGVMGVNNSPTTVSNRLIVRQDGNVYNATTQIATVSSFTTGDVIGVAFDADNRQVYFYKNGSSLGGPYSPDGSLDSFYIHFRGGTTGATGSFNFGQRAFAYPPGTSGGPSSDYKSLCTQNLPDPTVADGSTAMDAKLYTGNGSTQTISGLGFSPDLVWMKMRSTAGYSHKLVDQVRGATKSLASNNTNAELTETSGLTAFTSDGFSLGSQDPYNRNNDNFIAWTWDAGSSTVSNTDGSLESTVRANTSYGFSICKYTSGTGNQNDTVGHSLNAVPELILLKRRDGSDPFVVSHTYLSTGEYLELNSTSGTQTSANCFPTAHTSSVFGIGTDGRVNAGGNSYIAYCFAPVEGYSAFGSYTGTGTSDNSAPFVYTGFRPKFILFKATIAGQSWRIFDTARSSKNVANERLSPDTDGAETTSTNDNIDILSNGFKIRNSTDPLNKSSTEYIYAAFAEHPFKTARAK